MDITLSDLLPNENAGLSKIGFFFGAGSSLAAGYPLTYQLTVDVLKKLTPTRGHTQYGESAKFEGNNN